MRRRLESLLPALALVGFVAAALGVNLLLTSAERRGVDALEESVTGEVRAIAGSQNQRFANSLDGAGQLTQNLGPFTLEVDSEADLEIFRPYERVIQRAGLYLIDADGTITQGLLLRDGAIGEPFEWPGYDEIVASDGFRSGSTGGVLPVSDGYTTAEPVIAYLFPIADPATGTLQGAIALEQVVAADSDFNKEIGELKRGDTGTYYFYDDRGSVIASNDPAVIGRPLDDPRLIGAGEGFHRVDGTIVVQAEVPAAGWRVAFRQDEGEFDRSLAGPLQSVGQILVLAMLAGGFVVMALLYRRLRAARIEEERLRQLTEAQQEFISIVSHELRTPVAGVLGFLETSIDHWDVMTDDERRMAITRAASNARRLQAMTRDVLDTQSIESGRLVHVFERLDLRTEVQVAVDAARELAPDRPVELELPGEPVWVDGDADRLQQVLANLLDNARKNSPALEPVRVTLGADEAGAELTVIDRGPGIAEDSLEKIFDKFVRGRGDSVSGTGLGLYISRQIVAAHEGRIWAESAPGQGARFHVVLPRAAQPAGPVEAPATKL
jgi:signal transduction histidine kinase